MVEEHRTSNNQKAGNRPGYGMQSRANRKWRQCWKSEGAWLHVSELPLSFVKSLSRWFLFLSIKGFVHYDTQISTLCSFIYHVIWLWFYKMLALFDFIIFILLFLIFFHCCLEVLYSFDLPSCLLLLCCYLNEWHMCPPSIGHRELFIRHL